MTSEQRVEENEAAYWRLRPMIDQTYPKGRLVAIDQGRVVADAATDEELAVALKAQGIDSPDVLVAEAGFEYPRPDDYMGIWLTDAEDAPNP